MTKTSYAIADAAISDCQKYRYLLTRTFGEGKGVVTFIMLNPSTANALQDDPTIRRCVDFAIRWGYEQLRVVNLFAFRATDPKTLARAFEDDIIGPENDKYIKESCEVSDCIVLAWGAKGAIENRDLAVFELLKDFDLKCLGKTREHLPVHPLYQNSNLFPMAYTNVDQHFCESFRDKEFRREYRKLERAEAAQAT